MPIQHDLLKQQLVLACQIIVHLKLDSGPFGNVSVRVPGTDQFWVNPNGITFDQLSPHHLLLMDTKGNKLQGSETMHPGEVIHREIYALREDVGAIVHTHSESTVLLSLLGCAIQPYTQLGASLYQDQGLYLGFNGPVRSSSEGQLIAQALGNKSIVIAKNHGLFAAAKTLPAALWDMVIADTAAKIHLQARQLGLQVADELTEATLTKSRVEVRDKLCESMWASYTSALKKAQA